MEPWQYVPSIRFYVFRERIAQFLRERDHYPHWAVFIVEAGGFEYRLDDPAAGSEQGAAAEGQLLFCPPGSVLRRKVTSPLSFHFLRMDWMAAADAGAERPLPIPTGKTTVSDTRRLRSTLRQMRVWSERNDPESRYWQRHLFSDVWYLYCTGERTEEEAALPPSEDETMNRMLLWIQRNAFGPVHFRHLAASCGMTPVSFTRRFSRVFGVLPSDYVTSLRLQKAKRLLRDTDLTMAEIASRCGYDNEYYFSRIFSRKLHIPPSQFRKNAQL